MKKIIINADDFGYSKENNEAIKSGINTGVITSTSLMANMAGFEHAINEVLPAIPDADIGFHFNIMEGKSLTNSPLLCDISGNFNCSYQKLIYCSKHQNFINAIEKEFREQIEKILQYHNITHIDSHVHTHAIPEIFKLTVSLAKEYGIKYIRTQKEIPYIVKNKIMNIKFPVNIVKNILLNTYTAINNKQIIKTDIRTNNYFIGVLYTGYMDEEAIISGLKNIKEENSITEVIFHPYISNERNKRNNYREYLITQNEGLKQTIINMGFEFNSYANL